MAAPSKEIRLHANGHVHVLGHATDWAEVATIVDVHLDREGYDVDLHMDATASTETHDHFDVRLTTRP
jgi:hypothetical protein